MLTLFLFLSSLEVEEFVQQRKNLDSENRRLDHLVEKLQGPNNVSIHSFIFLK